MTAVDSMAMIRARPETGRFIQALRASSPASPTPSEQIQPRSRPSRDSPFATLASLCMRVIIECPPPHHLLQLRYVAFQGDPERVVVDSMVSVVNHDAIADHFDPGDRGRERRSVDLAKLGGAITNSTNDGLAGKPEQLIGIKRFATSGDELRRRVARFHQIGEDLGRGTSVHISTATASSSMSWSRGRSARELTTSTSMPSSSRSSRSKRA